MSIIRFARHQIAVRNAGGYRGYIEAAVASRWMGRAPSFDAVAGTIPAEIIRSNWVVQCPVCRGVVFAPEDDVFFCPDCMMAFNDGRAMWIAFPEERAEIERLLLLRPNPNNRNWLFGETVEQLVAENLEHGIGVD